MRALGVAIVVLAASPASALSYVVAGSFTPHSATDELTVFFGAVDTGGFPPNPLGFGAAGVYRVSFQLDAPATSHLELTTTDVYDEYDADDHYVGGDEAIRTAFISDTLGSDGAVLFKVPGSTVVTTPGGGTIYYTTLAAVLLQATFTSFDQPIAYEVRADRLGAIPEPGTWSLMIAGLGLAGAALRTRRAATTGPSLPPPATRLTSQQ